MDFKKIYYEANSLDYELGKILKDKYKDKEWIEIDSHNSIEELQKSENREFAKLKTYLIIGTRKTHKYVGNQKISDYLVPYTSSGCSAMCMYCYLVCNYNKCSYLRIFVNREQMLDKLIKKSNASDKKLVFEIGSNSDLVLENMITGNLVWTIEKFGEKGEGMITFPTKFHQIEPLLNLNHNEKTIFRMSVNPKEIIKMVEIGTSTLDNRISAINKMSDAGYKTSILIAPVVLVDNWGKYYDELIITLADRLSDKVKNNLVIEIIFMTYSYIHRMINNDAFPNRIELYDNELMKSRGYGKYTYKEDVRHNAERFIVDKIKEKLPLAKILYIC